MKSHPLKGWRKILALVAGSAISTVFPPAAPVVMSLTKAYLYAQGGIDLAEMLATGKQWEVLNKLTQDHGLQLIATEKK